MKRPHRDLAERMTSEAESELENKLAELYASCLRDINNKLQSYWKSFEREDAKMRDQLENGEIDEQYYQMWLRNHVTMGERWNAMRDQMAQKMTDTDKIASNYINGETFNIFANNANYTAFQIESAFPDKSIAFNLVDENAARNLASGANQYEFLIGNKRTGYRHVNVNDQRDYIWNTKQIQNAVERAIQEGSDIKTVAETFRSVMGVSVSGALKGNAERMIQKNYNAAVRNARTSITSAQNAGRQLSYENAHDMGIQLKKQWVATLDERTRDSHAWMDGTTVEYDEEFPTMSGGKLKYPADPAGEPSEVYNCRCTVIAVLPQTKEAINERWKYNEWLASKAGDE